MLHQLYQNPFVYDTKWVIRLRKEDGIDVKINDNAMSKSFNPSSSIEGDQDAFLDQMCARLPVDGIYCFIRSEKCQTFIQKC